MKPNLATVTIKEVLQVQSSDKFRKCLKYDGKVQDCSSQVVNCQKCGSMRADKYKYGLILKVEVKLSNDEELTIKFGDESLAKILNAEILTMDENSITEQLPFIEDIQITYSTALKYLPIRMR